MVPAAISWVRPELGAPPPSITSKTLHPAGFVRATVDFQHHCPIHDTHNFVIRTADTLQNHLSGGHRWGPGVTSMSHRLWAPDGHSPGKVTMGKRWKGALGRLQRELHPSPRCTVAAGKAGAGCGDPGEKGDGCRKAGRLCKKTASAIAALQERGDSKQLRMTGGQICLLGYSSVRQALPTN